MTLENSADVIFCGVGLSFIKAFENLFLNINPHFTAY